MNAAAAAAADCHDSTTAENMKSIYMLSCCADTSITHHNTAKGKGGLLDDDTHHDHESASNHHRHGRGTAIMKKTASFSSSSSRGGTRATPRRPHSTTPTPRKNNTSSINNTLPYSNSVPAFPDNKNNMINNTNLGNTKPFASNPLIYRYDDDNDSLWGEQSFFSLIASDTMEMNAPNINEEDNTTTVAAVDAPSYGYCTPHRNNYPLQQQQQQQNRSVSYNMPSQLNKALPPTSADDSPMIELSLAKQVANMAQMTNGNLRKTNREMLRNYRMMNHHGLVSSSSSSNRTITKDNNSSPSSPTKRTRENIIESSSGGGINASSGSGSVESGSANNISSHHHHHKKLAAMVPDEGGGISSSSAMDTDDDNSRPYYIDYVNASPTPVWSKVNSTTTSSNSTTSPDIIDPELLFTYKYPRLYLQDPTNVMGGIIHGRYNCDQMRELWWFHAAQRMETTLRHVQEDHWRALLSTTPTAVAQPSSTANPNISTKMKGSDSTNSFVTSTDGCVSMKELCLGKQHRQQQQGGGDSHTVFSPGKTPLNVWSEPCASTINVRGSTYSRDGIKVESEASIFSMLGVDSFVSGDKSAASGGGVGSSAGPTSGTASYLRRWKGICDEMGLPRPPFLLIINFIVPWGNFQSYLVRPDADDGPFSLGKRDQPSERAWRKFMEGSQEYRNKRLKLIPRIVAGPWMVKKMVGSTPALIGTKLPMSYRGSISENYLEIILDVTKGPAFGNSVANTVVGKADLVTVDLGFVIEGNEEEGHLPEQMLGLFRLHHLNMKKAPTQTQWNKER